MDVAHGPYTRLRGFSLIQLMATLGVLVSSLSLAVPNWTDFTQSNSVQSSRSEMMSLLNFARSTAITQRQYVTLCPSSDQQNCNNDFTAWHQGYMVFLDRDGNRSRSPEEKILRLGNTQRKGIKIYSSTGRRTIRFDSNGSTWGSNLTLRFCTANRLQNNRSIILYGSGRSRFSNKLSDGSAVSCE